MSFFFKLTNGIRLSSRHSAAFWTKNDVACRWQPYYHSGAGTEGEAGHWPPLHYTQTGTEGEASHWTPHHNCQAGTEGEASHWLQCHQEVQELMQGNIDNSMLPNDQGKAEWENVLGQAAATVDTTLDGTNWGFLPARSNERPQPFSFAENSIGPGLQPSGHLLPTFGEELQLPTAFRPSHQILGDSPWIDPTTIGSYNASDLTATFSVPFRESQAQNLVINGFSPDLDAVEARSANTAVPVGPSSLAINLSIPRRTSNECLPCAMSFTRHSDLTRHIVTQHTDRRPCDFCGKLMAVRPDKYKDHLKKWHKMNPDVASKYCNEWQ